VKERDEFDYQLGDEEKIVHKPALSNRGKTVAAYSIVKLKSGDVSREYMPVDEIEAIRRRGRSPDEGPWVTDFDEMARKTVFRRHYKKLPKSSDLDNVLSADDETFVPFKQPDAQPQAALPAPGQAGGERMPDAKVPQRSEALEKVVGSSSAQPPKPAAAEQPKAEEKPAAAAESGAPKDIL
jgi:recombination protein RecT